MTPPPTLPAFPHNPDNSLTAAQWMEGSVNLYQVAGSIRLQLLELQAAAEVQKKLSLKDNSH
ncbi:hypothetical protein [Zymomonas mobilis]|nr:hypothetical protein ZMO02_00540 [Zymomonas mobilis subsp. pomaceae]